MSRCAEVIFLYAGDDAVADGGADQRVRRLAESVGRHLPVSVVDLRPSRGAAIRTQPRLHDRARAAVLGVPPRLSQGFDAHARPQVAELVRQARLVVANTIFSLAFIPADAYPRVVLDAHNVEQHVVKHLARTDPNPARRLAYRATSAWTGYYERRAAQRVAGVWAVSKSEADWFASAGASRVDVLPNGVEIPERTAPVANAPPNLVFVGSLAGLFNREGVEWFLAECWPRVQAEVPNATLTLVGRGGEAFQGNGVRGLGFVGALADVYCSAAAAIVPLHAGAGTRLKVIEAWGYGVPVVSTTVGCDGIDVEPGRDCLLGDEPEAFARECVALLRDGNLRGRVGRAGRCKAAGDYDWSAIGRRAAFAIEELLECA